MKALKNNSSLLYTEDELIREMAFLSQLSEEEKNNAFHKYKIIEPYITKSSTLKSVAAMSGISLRTLNIWIKKYRNSGVAGLARKTRNDKGTTRVYDIQLQKAIEGIYLSGQHLTSANIHHLIKRYCQHKNLTSPSYRTVCKIIERIPDDLITLGIQGTKAYQQKYDFLHIRSAEKPNEIWQADHVLVDIEILNDRLKPQKPWLTVIIDDCSRAICGYELSFLSPSAQKTSLCLRHAIWRKQDPKWEIFGIPTVLYTDHGSDFTSNHIEQVCADLKIRMMYSIIGQPRGRGKIERFFRTLNQKLISIIQEITHSSTSPKYLDLKALNQLVYKYIIEYNHECHSNLAMSPTARWQLNGFIPQILGSIEELDLLLITEAKSRKILRDGIHFQGLRYIDPILVEYVGEHIVLRYNPSDITSIRIFYKGRFLCQALCSELSREKIGIKEIQKIRNQQRRKLKKQVLERKSMAEAIIAANSKGLQFTHDEEEQLLVEKKKPPKLKLYKYD